ncbi:MAG: MarR family transcriptional regulator [Dehalococcoidia bacterium]|nr:MarR family transcriptional regulator [Dehalococcoidia bacterium]
MGTDREQLVAKIAELKDLMMRTASDHWQGDLVELDLTLGQLKVLFLLYSQPRMRMSTLAEILGVTLPSCTNLVERLTKAGMVERRSDPGDRRVVLCVLTPEGEALINRLRQNKDMLPNKLLGSLTVDELRIVVKAMELLQKASLSLKASV